MTSLGTDRLAEPTADQQAELDRLYADFAAAHLTPLWTQRAGLMPPEPQPDSVPMLWRWSTLYPLAERSGRLVPVGRGGERRAIALANPGLPGTAYATPTLWAAIQYLGPHELAPSHRHSQTAFRFVVEGEGVWTNVDGDPVAMRRGDLLLTPGMHFHEHHNTTDHPMAWIDGLDIPLVRQLDAGFFEFGPDDPFHPRHPRRLAQRAAVGTPRAAAGRCADASRVAADGLPVGAHRRRAGRPARAGGARGIPRWSRPGHAAVRFTDPTTAR